MPYWLESDRPKWQELLLPISQSISFLRPYWLQNSPRIHHYLPYFGESASSHNSCKNSAKGDRKCAKPLWIKNKDWRRVFLFLWPVSPLPSSQSQSCSTSCSSHFLLSHSPCVFCMLFNFPYIFLYLCTSHLYLCVYLSLFIFCFWVTTGSVKGLVPVRALYMGFGGSYAVLRIKPQPLARKIFALFVWVTSLAFTVFLGAISSNTQA